MLKKSTFIFTILFTVFFLAGCDENEKTAQKKQQKNPNEFILTSIDDKSLTLIKTQHGFYLKDDPKKLVLIDIYATWCPPCQSETPVLSDLQKRYDKELLIIGVTIEENITNDKLHAFAKKYEATYTLVNSKENKRLVDAVAQNLQIGTRFPIPLMAIYKKEGVVNFYKGATEEEFIESDIKQTIGK